ncbi:unnamed protein product (macronuclear) [Paramecium tetraurelia]|uniref:RRM domain-containing protein n=1 Tax=Paramecium tetraurelia TaxID=5888 RepID=A0EGC2_PARTE|nr:uncharacterized protein GSPATT00026687001 [Paramecium tetraurelia]CAK94363.1 unnamed protein product [Paramecium tetraurelia]|eukprot:XP_001461736.1 hypothetical protein (macronuclear) [Paramecium tetraurelia strain d4-2]
MDQNRYIYFRNLQDKVDEDFIGKQIQFYGTFLDPGISGIQMQIQHGQKYCSIQFRNIKESETAQYIDPINSQVKPIKLKVKDYEINSGIEGERGSTQRFKIKEQIKISITFLETQNTFLTVLPTRYQKLISNWKQNVESQEKIDQLITLLYWEEVSSFVVINNAVRIKNIKNDQEYRSVVLF